MLPFAIERSIGSGDKKCRLRHLKLPPAAKLTPIDVLRERGSAKFLGLAEKSEDSDDCDRDGDRRQRK